jgi:hypothetical protein
MTGAATLPVHAALHAMPGLPTSMSDHHKPCITRPSCVTRATSETLAAKKRYREEQRLKRPPSSDHGPPPASFAALGELAAQQGRNALAQQSAVEEPAATEEQENDQGAEGRHAVPSLHCFARHYEAMHKTPLR